MGHFLLLAARGCTDMGLEMGWLPHQAPGLWAQGSTAAQWWFLCGPKSCWHGVVPQRTGWNSWSHQLPHQEPSGPWDPKPSAAGCISWSWLFTHTPSQITAFPAAPSFHTAQHKIHPHFVMQSYTVAARPPTPLPGSAGPPWAERRHPSLNPPTAGATT